jgi:hypothetical protein
MVQKNPLLNKKYPKGYIPFTPADSMMITTQQTHSPAHPQQMKNEDQQIYRLLFLHYYFLLLSSLFIHKYGTVRL